MRRQISLRAFTRESETAERLYAAVDQAVRRALLHAAGLKVSDVRRDTGPDGECEDVLFERIRAVTASDMRDAILGYAGDRAVLGTYKMHGPDSASIQVRPL